MSSFTLSSFLDFPFSFFDAGVGDRELAEEIGLARSAYMSSESALRTELLLEEALDFLDPEWERDADDDPDLDRDLEPDRERDLEWELEPLELLPLPLLPALLVRFFGGVRGLSFFLPSLLSLLSVGFAGSADVGFTPFVTCAGGGGGAAAGAAGGGGGCGIVVVFDFFTGFSPLAAGNVASTLGFAAILRGDGEGEGDADDENDWDLDLLPEKELRLEDRLE